MKYSRKFGGPSQYSSFRTSRIETSLSQAAKRNGPLPIGRRLNPESRTLKAAGSLPAARASAARASRFSRCSGRMPMPQLSKPGWKSSLYVTRTV